MNSIKTLRRLVSMMIIAGCFALPLFASTATVVSIEGKVEVARKGGWVALSANDTVREGEVISTGFKSKAVIRYEGSVMQLGPLTRITLEKLLQGTTSDSVNVYLNTGVVKSTVRQTENKRVSYTVRNPVAVASVRGTEFDFQANGAISCTEGAIVTYAGSQFSANEGVPSSGSSNVATNADEIAPGAPAGSVVVLPGQNVAFSNIGLVSSPVQGAVNDASSVLVTTAIPADIEGVNTAAPNVSSSASGSSATNRTGFGVVRVAAYFE
ncbi:MAG: FecR domain-containing protein [Treponema sp.]|nr:FecR domain-containing protein [Treponema sp.]